MLHNGVIVGGLYICYLLIMISRHFWNNFGNSLEHLFEDVGTLLQSFMLSTNLILIVSNFGTFDIEKD